jgi:hypothetical protein
MGDSGMVSGIVDVSTRLMSASHLSSDGFYASLSPNARLTDALLEAAVRFPFASGFGRFLCASTPKKIEDLLGPVLTELVVPVEGFDVSFPAPDLPLQIGRSILAAPLIKLHIGRSIYIYNIYMQQAPDWPLQKIKLQILFYSASREMPDAFHRWKRQRTVRSHCLEI